MLQKSGAIYQESDRGLTVIARILPSGAGHIFVRLAGEIDMDSSNVLTRMLDRLMPLAPTRVVVDLAAVTFACSTLPNFVARVRLDLPDDVEIILCRARPATIRLLRDTGMEMIATIHAEPTAVPA